MQVDVDQSGKIEWTQKPTVLAFTNGERFTIIVPAQVKREVFQELSARHPTRSRTMHRMLLFATLLFLLLRTHIDRLDHVRIDIEYQGHSSTIKGHMLNLFRRQGIEVEPDRINFQRIGKKSPAHDLAIKVFRGKVLPDQVISAEQILAEFGK